MPTELDVIRPGGPIASWKLRAWELAGPRLPRGAMRLLGRLIFRLPRGSRARRWWVVGLSQIAWNATARSRFDLILPLWDPDCEWRWGPQFSGLGFEDVYRGHDGVKRSLQHWHQAWEDIDFALTEVLDGGDTLVTRITVTGRGSQSGVPVSQSVSAVAHLNPLIVRFSNHADDGHALEEAGFL